LRTFIANMSYVDIAGVNVEEGYMDVFVSYEGLIALYLSGFTVEVISTGDVGIFQLEPEYYTYPEVVSELSQIQTDHSAIAKKISLGTSYEGRDIPGIKISDNVGTEESEPEIFICALHHAREAATVNVAMYIINQLTNNYGSNQTVTDLVNGREIYIIPIVNPDGKVYDDSGGSYGSGLSWRKNRQPCSGGIGTDLNRNYSYGWGGSGSSGTCTSDTFRGYAAFDAPETAAVRDFFNAHPDINVLLTYHSHGNLVLWPWGYTYDPIADANDRAVHETMGEQYASYVNYTPQQSADLYLASGTTDDWSFGVTQNDDMPCFSFTVEMGNEFYPPVSTMNTLCTTNYQGALYFIDCADNPYKVLPTPEPLEITNPSNNDTVSGTVNITCDAEPEIVKVEFYIDGSLKSTDTTSPFSWSWDTTGYSDASHTILVKGYDSGNGLVDDDTITVTVDNSGSCLGTVLLGILMLFGSVTLYKKK
jgi:carboxypeptidase T